MREVKLHVETLDRFIGETKAMAERLDRGEREQLAALRWLTGVRSLNRMQEAIGFHQALPESTRFHLAHRANLDGDRKAVHLPARIGPLIPELGTPPRRQEPETR